MSIFDITLYENLPWQFTSLFVMLGAAVGSFFNVLSLRWPAYQLAKNDAESHFWLKLRGHLKKDLSPQAEQPNLMAGRSHCPTCSKAIPLYHNIPIFSWLFLRGKSACCSKPIKIRYFAFEAFGALTFLAIAITIGPSVAGLLLGLILMTLSLMAVIDLAESFIPEPLLFVAFFMSYGLAMSPIGIGLQTAFLSHMLTFFGLYITFSLLGKLMERDLVGTGDFHLLALCASLLGSTAWFLPILIWPFATVTWFLSKSGAIKKGVFAGVIGSTSIPAGPAIVASTFCLIALKQTGVL